MISTLRRWLICWLCLFPFFVSAAGIVDQTWRDPQRNRDIPAKIYYPDFKESPAPVIFFSHGLGGSRRAAECLGEASSSAGFISIHLQHPGSDESVWKGQGIAGYKALKKAAADPRLAQDRGEDARFAIAYLETLNRSAWAGQGLVRTHGVGYAGHSFGAHTTLLVADMKMGVLSGSPPYLEPEVLAAVPLSSPVSNSRMEGQQPYSSITIPCMHVTGTEDDSPIGSTSPEQRRIPFDRITATPQFLLIYQGADHSVFGGRTKRNQKDSEAREKIQASVARCTTQFFRAHVAGDAKAREWLSGGGLTAEAAALARVEIKR